MLPSLRCWNSAARSRDRHQIRDRLRGRDADPECGKGDHRLVFDLTSNGEGSGHKVELSDGPDELAEERT